LVLLAWIIYKLDTTESLMVRGGELSLTVNSGHSSTEKGQMKNRCKVVSEGH
jgi:hypothetical protein